MKDVAGLARVSKMTVSRALARPDSVSAETRERVMRAIKELDYVPDRVAGALSSRKTGFVGLILPTLTNANFAGTAQGLADSLREENCQLLISYTLYDVEEEERQIRALLTRRPDAIVILGTNHTPATIEILRRAHIPVVEIWDLPDEAIGHVVGFSNWEAGYRAAQHLISLGHLKIGAIGHDADTAILDARGENRLRGFTAALRDAGLSDEHIVRTMLAPASFEQGSSGLGLMLRRTPDIEAIFAVADVPAFGALMECHRRRIRVPEDISLLGFGDFDLSRQCVPSLSTIRCDVTEIGRRTGEVLLPFLRGEADPATAAPRREVIRFELIHRETTAVARRLLGREEQGGTEERDR